MTYQVTLKDKVTGKEQTVIMDGDWDVAADYLWTEGNFACDCNRELQFCRVAGTEPTSLQCGDTRYELVKHP